MRDDVAAVEDQHSHPSFTDIEDSYSYWIPQTVHLNRVDVHVART
ncbi:uncharacterized protein METZ01_LOCUS408635 [marine metagenome]|uniref:Uncharacterized protein n=1 Tax=marine metagenome TaxID=408172 RepID=A0A382WCB4_9ZZZZ